MRMGFYSRASLAGITIVAFAATFIISPIAQALNTHSVDLEQSSSQYLSISDGSQTGLDVTGNITIEAWIKPETLPNGDLFVIAGKDGDGGSPDPTVSERGYALTYDDWGSGVYKFTFNVSPDGSGANLHSHHLTQTLSTGTWYHVAVVWTAAAHSATFYINGSPAGTDSSGSVTSIYDSSAPFMIGSRLADASQTYLDGKIDDVRVWNTTRTAQQIADNKDTELNGNETGLVGYWKLNNALTDSTANGNTLTNNNSATFSSDTNGPTFTEDLTNRKSVNESVTSSAVVQNDDQLKLSLASNKTYIIDGVIFASSTSGTPDIKVAFTGQTGSNIKIGYTDDVDDMVLQSGEESNTIALQANRPRSIHVAGTVVTGSASGDFQLKWAQDTSNANATTVMAGSYLRAQEI